jgi:putative FmdB family regulatory protein
MPTYVYSCDGCGQTFERRQSISDAPLVDCPECEGRVHRLIQPVGVVFKASGFYVTDNRTSSPSSNPSPDSGEKKTKAGKEKKE